MTVDDVIAAFELPASSLADKRVPKSQLTLHGAFTSADRKIIQEGIEEVRWIAALKPGNCAVQAHKNETRDYSEIVFLSAEFRPQAKIVRLIELLHRAIPYPLVLIEADPSIVSLAHKRFAQNEAGKVVLDPPIHRSDALGATLMGVAEFLAELPVARHPAAHFHALYERWIAAITALHAARILGTYPAAGDADSASRLSDFVLEHERVHREIETLRSRAAKETQVNRRVELNLEIKRLEALLNQKRSGLSDAP